MNIEIQEKLDDVIKEINKDSRIIELKKLKKKLLSNDDLMSLIKEIQKNPDLLYIKKKEIYSNLDYLKYQTLENEIYFLTLEINKRLNKLTDSKGCRL